MPPSAPGDREKIRHLRERIPLTQKEFAQAIGYSQNHVNRVERGDHGTSVDFLRASAEVFGCTVKELLLPEEPVPCGCQCGCGCLIPPPRADIPRQRSTQAV